jgi:hypothetical protein
MHWIIMGRSRDQWWAPVEMVTNLRVP